MISLISVTRKQLAGSVGEYTALLRVGNDPHDVIGIHRVVREKSPGMPAGSTNAVFMVHGDQSGFDVAFNLSSLSPAVPPTQSLAIFLANAGVDVWGIDLRSVNVAADTTDFTFMKNWNIATNIRDIETALVIGRDVRQNAGGDGRMILLGFSRGAWSTYALTAKETTVSGSYRNVRGHIPLDAYFKLNPSTHQEQIQLACARSAFNQDSLAHGVYASDQGKLVAASGFLAEVDPDSPSPFFPGLTNLQVGLVAGAQTYVFFNGAPHAPLLHFTAGTFSPFGLPTGFIYTTQNFFFDQSKFAFPYQAIAENADADAITCNQTPDPYSPLFGAIKIPVFYFGAEGAFGSYGLDTLALMTGSTDRTSRIISLSPDRANDFGHQDLLLANNASTLVWPYIRDWVKAH